MRIAAIIIVMLSLSLAIAGCKAPRGDLVEAELRTKERMLRETQSELERTRLVNEALERDYMNRQDGRPRSDNSGFASPKDITLANGTGGLDEDRLPGDEALMLVVLPRDEDGQPVRAVGTLSVGVWEVMPGGQKVGLSQWEVSATDLRRTWKSGLLGSGYHVILPWKKFPSTEKLRVAVQLTLPDGRVYETDKDISIRPMPGQLPPPEKVMPMAPMGPLLKSVEE